MVKIENIVSGAILEFDDNTDPEYAVLYAQCVEDSGLASWFFCKIIENKLDEVKSKIKLRRGKLTISSGDWVYRKTLGVYPGSNLE